MTELFAELDSYRELNFRGWDAEDALPVREETIERAKAFCEFVKDAADAFGLRWEDPSPAPTCDGGIDLDWDMGECDVRLTVDCDSAEVHCVSHVGRGPGHCLSLPEEEAACLALWVLTEGRR